MGSNEKDLTPKVTVCKRWAADHQLDRAICEQGRQHPDRDAQFRYISEQARAHQEAGDPVISVDTKKKELVGDFANGGKEYRPKGSPVPVRTHDFMDKELGKAIPYGVYDVVANAG